MEFLTELWLAILLSSVFVFVVSSVIHMALPWHKGDVRKMSNEDAVLEAMRASGVSLLRILRPVFMLTVAMMALNVALVSYIQPFSRYNYFGLVFDLRSGALGASIKVGEFVNLSDDMVLRIDESRDNGAELIGVFLERTEKIG